MPSPASTAPATALRADRYDYLEARRIASALDLVEPIAVTLVRRGYRTVEEAKRFLEARDEHDPFEFEGMEGVCELILSHVRRSSHITVHGDYDVDGVCSTSIVVSTLRSLGARCDWLIPDRLADGYGLTGGAVAELRRRGTGLLITVDCGIGSAQEVAAAQAAGIEVVVTDHHQPPGRLPDCPVLHPVLSGYPFTGLCAAGVAHKLASALLTAAGARYTETAGGRRDVAARDLDLVALATVADLVPLIGENRRLVRQGLTSLRTRARVGLRALMSVARVEPETIDEGALGYRLAPRINAAGRLYRADAGVELMLTEDSDRAGAIALELDRANAERRAAEREVDEAAERARAALPPELAHPALVLAGEGWHPGVVGIAASRLVERHWRPTVLISLGGAKGRGSARSIPGFDLATALDACSEHLLRHGGHRAAAGLEIEAGRIDGFREAFLAHAAEAIAPADLVRSESVDALVGVGRGGIGMELAEQLERLAPFGQGNPDPRLVVPWGRLRSIRPLGEEGRHSRFDLESGAGRALGVAFGVNGELSGREDQAADLSVRLELDRWNGAVQPRIVLRELHPLEPTEEQASGGCGSAGCPAPEEEWWLRLGAEMKRWERPRRASPLDSPGAAPWREIVDRRGGAAVAALAELVSSGDSVLALCADASRRCALARSAANPRRFGAGDPAIACGRCGEDSLNQTLGREGSGGPVRDAPPGLVLADWAALARRPLEVRRFRHLVLVDPPPFEHLDALVHAGATGGAPFAPGFLHLAWGPPEVELAERCLAAEWMLRAPIVEIWRAVREAGGEARGQELRLLLAGQWRHPRPPEVAGRCLRVLCELGLGECDLDRGTPRLRVLSSKRIELARSRAFAACVARHQEGLRYLQSRAQSG